MLAAEVEVQRRSIPAESRRRAALDVCSKPRRATPKPNNAAREQNHQEANHDIDCKADGYKLSPVRGGRPRVEVDGARMGEVKTLSTLRRPS
ncbi:hypothetical protein GCM10007918_07270 [Piscinibacter gummiphilus]|nr:hypothetical protein GCM10007918_07270 [Piscinibacter gummiphilus]